MILRSELLWQQKRELFRPPAKLTIAQWAERHRYLPRGTSPEPGQFSFVRTPFAREPMEAITDPHNGETVIVAGRQLFKSEVQLNAIGYFIEADPSPMLLVHPSLDMAKKFSKKKIAPMIAACPVLRERFGPLRTRDSSNTILVKTFPGGDLTIAGANSPSSFRQESRRVIIQDDIDAYPASAGNEGDPCDLADGRAENYHNAIFVKASTPTIKGASRIVKAFEATDQSYFHVPCPRCGCWQVLKWRQVKWPKNEPEKAVYVCEGCQGELTDFERIRMITQGQWRPSKSHRRRRGFHLSGLYRMMGLKEKEFSSYLHQFAVQFLDANQEGRESLKQWTNTFLAETWEEEGEKPIEILPVMNRAEKYSPDNLPSGVIIALAGVDVQDRWLQIEVVGLGLDDETWGIEAKVIEGDTQQDAVWDDLLELLTTKYKRSDGMEITIHATAIDTRFRGDRVSSFIRRAGLPRIYPVHGVEMVRTETRLAIPRRPDRYGLRTHAVNGNEAKARIFSRLSLQEHGPRYMHYPCGHGYNEEYFLQLTGEVFKTKFVHGFPVGYYEKIRPRNEALDIRVYLLAAVDILKPNLTTIAKKLKVPGEQPKAGAPDKPAQPQRQRIRVGMPAGNPFRFGGMFK